MTYDPRPAFNKWANQYKAVIMPVFMNTSDAGLLNDYAPTDLREDFGVEERSCECVTCGRPCLGCVEGERDDD